MDISWSAVWVSEPFSRTQASSNSPRGGGNIHILAVLANGNVGHSEILRNVCHWLGPDEVIEFLAGHDRAPILRSKYHTRIGGKLYFVVSERPGHRWWNLRLLFTWRIIDAWPHVIQLTESNAMSDLSYELAFFTSINRYIYNPISPSLNILGAEGLATK